MRTPQKPERMSASGQSWNQRSTASWRGPSRRRTAAGSARPAPSAARRGRAPNCRCIAAGRVASVAAIRSSSASRPAGVRCADQGTRREASVSRNARWESDRGATAYWTGGRGAMLASDPRPSDAPTRQLPAVAVELVVALLAVPAAFDADEIHVAAALADEFGHHVRRFGRASAGAGWTRRAWRGESVGMGTPPSVYRSRNRGQSRITGSVCNSTLTPITLGA